MPPLLPLFNALFTTGLGTISVPNFLIGVASALGLGVVLALIYMFKSVYTKSFVVTLAILPAVVAIVIMMVSGSLGAGVAAAGAFSLVRFRSIPGSSRDICMLFLAMASGLVCGMGFMWYALVFTVILAIVIIAAEKLVPPNRAAMRQLKITIPEDMDYDSFKARALAIDGMKAEDVAEMIIKKES